MAILDFPWIRFAIEYFPILRSIRDLAAAIFRAFPDRGWEEAIGWARIAEEAYRAGRQITAHQTSEMRIGSLVDFVVRGRREFTARVICQYRPTDVRRWRELDLGEVTLAVSQTQSVRDIFNTAIQYRKDLLLAQDPSYARLFSTWGIEWRCRFEYAILGGFARRET